MKFLEFLDDSVGRSVGSRRQFLSRINCTTTYDIKYLITREHSDVSLRLSLRAYDTSSMGELTHSSSKVEYRMQNF